MSDKPRVLVIAGPTGSGKSSLSMGLAKALDGEIVGCDSVQLYKGFNIGSAKPTHQDLAEVPHHLVDMIEPQGEFDAAQFGDLATKACLEIASRGKRPILVGGSGLYLRTLVGDGWHGDLPTDEKLREELNTRPLDVLYEELMTLDPVRAGEIHANDKFRIVRALELFQLLGKPLRELPKSAPPFDAKIILIMPERAALHRRIEKRVTQMLEEGLIQEVDALLRLGVLKSAKPMQSIGYKEVLAFMDGEFPRDQLAEKICASTRQYAKRQCTWFRKVDVDLTLETPDLEQVLEFLKT